MRTVTQLTILVPLLVSCGGRSLPAAADGAPAPSDDAARTNQVDAAQTKQVDATVDPACAGVSCGLVNDCCQCQAYDNSVPPPMPPCTAICDAPMCEALGIAGPQPYCFRGRCFLTAQQGTCNSDADCQLVNDCCNCLALPRAAAQSVAATCLADCFVGQCTGLGLAGVSARCVAGTCRLAF